MKFTADRVTQWPRGRNDLVPPASHRPRAGAAHRWPRRPASPHTGPSVKAQLCGPGLLAKLVRPSGPPAPWASPAANHAH